MASNPLTDADWERIKDLLAQLVSSTFLPAITEANGVEKAKHDIRLLVAETAIADLQRRVDALEVINKSGIAKKI